MDRKKIVGLMVVGIMLAVIVVMAAPVSAYDVYGNKNTQVVQLYFDKSEAWSLFLWPGCAADVVIHEANLKGIPIQRSRDTIKTEISAHAELVTKPNIPLYRNGRWRWSHEIANPMDIEMYKAEMWVYLLD